MEFAVPVLLVLLKTHPSIQVYSLPSSSDSPMLQEPEEMLCENLSEKIA